MFSLYDKKLSFDGFSICFNWHFLGDKIFKFLNSGVVMFRAPQQKIGQTISAVLTIDPKIFKGCKP